MSRFVQRLTSMRRAPNLRRGLALLAGASVLSASGVLVAIGAPGANVTGPQPVDRQVTVAVTSLLKKEHLSRHPIDNDISRRWLKMYLKTLDPMKVYFTQEDVDAFSKKQDELDDLAKRGDIAFGHQVFQVFLQRIDERVKLVDELLHEKHDFTVDEDMATDPEAHS
jgi:carboxyl-terminal processing protease